MLRQNDWANRKMLNFCEGIPEATLDAAVHGTYGEVRATLVHLVAALERYCSQLTGTAPNLDSPINERKPWPGFEALKQSVARSGDALVKLAEERPEGWELKGVYQGKPYVMPASVPLTQVVNHCTEHRSQIMTILTQAGVQPPELDAWSWNDELGLTRES
jgi:uncharacterized damage-inducible protein DinB